MKSRKNVFKILTLLILLLTIAALPVAVAYIQNNMLISKIKIKQIDKEEMQSDKLTTEEKLQIIYRVENSDELDGNNILFVDNEKERDFSELKSIVQEQIFQMVEKNVLPELNFTENFSITSDGKMLFFDSIDFKNVVSLRRLFIQDENFDISIYIDTNNFKIYNIDFYIYHEVPEFSKSFEYSLLGFFDYLGLSSKKVTIKGDYDRGVCIYENEKAQLIFEYEFEPNELRIWFST